MSKVPPGCRESVSMTDMEETFVPEDRVSLKVSVHILQMFHMPTVGCLGRHRSYNPAAAIHIPTSDGQYQQLHAQSFIEALLNQGA